MSHLIGIKRAQLGQLAIAIAPHLVHQALLAVHDLVMRQRQNEIFGHPIHPGKSQHIQMIASKKRIHLEEVQNVVHPAHVPLVIESERIFFKHSRDLGARRAFFSNQNRLRMGKFDDLVELAQKVPSFEVAIPAVFVRFPRLVAIVQINHVRHRIDPKPVQVEFFNPKECA